MMETMGRAKRPRRSFTEEFKAEVVAGPPVGELGGERGTGDLDLTETAASAAPTFWPYMQRAVVCVG